MRTFKDAINHREFATCAEMFLRPETDAESLRIQAGVLSGHVDGILLTDNQYGQLHPSVLTAAAVLLGEGVDPIVQFACRNRNRIALLSDLLGAATLGVSSLMLVAGERVADSMNPRPKPVRDLSAVELIRTAAAFKDNDTLTTDPDFMIGGVVTPVLPKPGWEAKQFREKVDAGAQYLQTHICMDVELLRRYLHKLVENRLIRRVSVVGSVAVIGHADDAQWLRDNRPNVMLTDDIVQRMQSASDARAEGIRIAVETLEAMREIPGLVGANLMASRDLTAIPEVIEAAGLGD